jgi:autotransporter translocation and assembly factor TamB
MSKHPLILSFALALLLLAVLTGLLATQAGSRWLLQRVIDNVPGKASVGAIHGRLLDHLVLGDVNYADDNQSLSIKKLELRWQPRALFSRRLKINDLIVENIALTLHKMEKQPKQDSTFKGELALPVAVDIDNCLLTNSSINGDGFDHVLHQLHLSITTVDDKINLNTLTADADLGHVNANGFISTTAGLPLKLNLNWLINPQKNQNWQGEAAFNGDLNKLLFSTQLITPFPVKLNGTIQDVLKKTPKITLNGEWRNLVWPIASATPNIQSPIGQIQLNGTTDAYKVTVGSQLVRNGLPKTELNVDGTGNLQAFNLTALELKSADSTLELTGQIAWQPLITFNLSLDGQRVNPALFVPELPGNLAISTHVKGVIDPKALQLDADITQITGTLRNKPFNANGKIKVNGEQVQVDKINIASGKNQLAVNGHINPKQGDLRLKLDLPQLASLWPTLAGNIKGDGELTGGWQQPSLRLAANANNLKFVAYSADKLVIDIDYSATSNQISQLSVIASGIRTNNHLINSIKLNGNGTLSQHTFAAEMDAPQAKLTTGLTGNWQQPIWSGELNKININLPNDQLWSLANKVPIRIERKANGIDAVINEICLTRQSAAICSKFNVFANGDFNASLVSKALPTGLLQPFLPPDINLSSVLDGELQFQRKLNVLNGTYNFATSPALLSVAGKDGTKSFRLNPSKLLGTVKGDEIMADLNLNLTGDDYLRSHLLLNIGKSQHIAGQVTAAIADFSPLQAFVPELSHLNGRLAADLNLQGALTHPAIKGYFDLVDAELDNGQFGLRQLNLHGNVAGKNGDQIQLHGSTMPIVLNKPDAGQSVNINAQVSFTANFKQQPTLIGDFSLNLPANTAITLRSEGQKKQLALGASSLTGTLRNNRLLATLDLALTGQDYVRGNLQMATTGTKALSGKLNATIRDFGVVETFAPDLSDVKGLLTADVTLSGTSQKPTVNGTMHLTGGALTVEQLGANFHDIDMIATTPLLSDNVQIRGSAASGKGMLKMDGTIGLQPEAGWPTAITLSGKDFEVAKLPEAEIAISPALKFGRANNLSKISGELAIPKAIIKVEDIPENAVNVSPDEIILGETKPDEKSLTTSGLQTDITVSLGKAVSFSGQGLQTKLNGNLRVIDRASKMTLQGSINMADASYKSYGQNLSVRKGQFVFNGPVDNPWLTVEAIRLSKSKKVTAILSLSGTLDSPQTRISSEPALPESEALAYLLTGSPLNQVSKSDSNMLASAAIAYGADQASWLAEQLGISEFSVQEGNTLKDTLLVMGKYLTPDFYLGAKVGMFNKQAVLVLKHKLIDNINVETQAGTSQRIKLNYEFDGD